MTDGLLVSIIITSYNYGRFLKGSIDSALAQTYRNLEVVVVDDGSTDDSRDVMASYGQRILPVVKENGGMASAFNAGFRVCHGDIVCFLDADDTLLPHAAERAAMLFQPGVAKVHWPLSIVDDHGRQTGATCPERPLSEGDLLERVLRYGDEGYVWSLTSGNAWARSCLQQLLPMPEEAYRDSGESYLATLAPAFGAVRAVQEPMGTYRLHNQSLSTRGTIRDVMAVTERRYELLETALRKRGLDVDTRLWPPDAATRKRISESCAELETLLPPRSRFLFVEWNQWGPRRVLAERQAIPFLEKGGHYWGRPADDAVAIEDLERLRNDGAEFIVFAWPALWWMEHYSGLAQHLHSRYANVRQNDNLIVFDLRETHEGPTIADHVVSTPTHGEC